MNSEDLKKWLKDRDYESLQFQPGQHFLIYKFNGNCIDCDSDRAGFDFVITRHPHYNPATPLALLQVTNDPHNPVRLKEPKENWIQKNDAYYDCVGRKEYENLQRRVEELELSVKGMSRHIEYLDDGLDKLEAWRKAE